MRNKKEDEESYEMKEERTYRMERLENQKEIDFRIWRINFWENNRIIPNIFDIIDDYGTPVGT